ncbi:MAG: serine/threonine protein kinase [Planctomycetaceae bacterium]|nr:serine/threonine protein kinase [Planctomycetaceae bacterium]
MSQAITPEQLSQRIIDAGLVDSREMQSLFAEFGIREVTLPDLTSLLLRRELLTNFQLDRLFKGEKGGYFYGENKVLYLVGNGTFARVYRAVNTKTGKIVAVKALRKRFRDDKEMTEQFIREGKIGMQVRHPSIVPIYDSDHLPSPHLVMEFIEGSNLREFVRVRKRLDPVEAMKIIVDVLAGLAFAAEKGHSHRDLKMSNVLITTRGQAKLVDFGLAAGSTGDSQTSQRTVDYVGLERASGIRTSDPRSDLFFVGVILYNMLAGVSPIGEARDRTSRLAAARYQNIKPITVHDPNLPTRLVAFVSRALELNPERRHASAQEMHDDAKRLLAKLEEGDIAALNTPEPAPAIAASSADGRIPSDQEGNNRTILVVESKIEMQDVLRDRLRKHGYKVLIFSDPKRPLQRYQDAEKKLCDCALFCTSELGDAALAAFNEWGATDQTRDVPAILMVDNRQTEIVKAAQLSDHRVLLSLPFKMRELRVALMKLLRPGYQPVMK